MNAFNYAWVWRARRYIVVTLASLSRGLGLLLLFLAVGASRGAEPLLRASRRRPRQERRASRLQSRLLALLARLQLRHTDPLTGIASQSSAQREMQKLLDADQAFMLIRLSIDNVKRINKTLGYDIGDQLLVALTQRLIRLEYHHGRLYRLGGNEFLMLVSPPIVGTAFLEQLREHLGQPLQLSGTSLIPTIALAILQGPEDGRNVHQLLYRSSIALVQARQSRDGFHVYQCGLDHRHEREKRLLQDLVHAVQHQQLKVVYQPKIRIANGQVAGFEALLQWQHPSLGLLQPDEFLPLAVHSGHMALIGSWMMECVMDHMAEWQVHGYAEDVAVNLSAVDLDDTQLAGRLLAGLNRRRLPARHLMLEITEQTMMLDPALAARLLEELRDQGIRVAIDDFGTGYSSLAQLRHLPLDVLKIDKSFVMGLPSQREDTMIVNSSIALAHDFGLEVIAEGVETPQQLALLAKAGCDQAQGYLISRAMDADRVIPWLKEYRASAPPSFLRVVQT
ncbi:diguanylate cyclase (GGDEF) domain-containing protein [Modicisalibacter ilicicola DSM 19980]|uniref:Diguanylate cyclase (GGDEF) domain-containing protein n=1 Tax=Modicisalibacter ilicicola DSM 19980 TaxID=1121942 RepID=A0A1M5D7W1_9GAMM|nr:bifunctional diguanylate cyclase/phosphodiesterase [Halomonas ilicicola]SHF62955.1 diguanylate cyclase (GGDEF) domain-containing protein [Halomonas ilicicola DSM 19980]